MVFGVYNTKKSKNTQNCKDKVTVGQLEYNYFLKLSFLNAIDQFKVHMPSKFWKIARLRLAAIAMCMQIILCMYSMHCILCIVFYLLYSLHCILCIVVYALYSMHSIICIVSSALYSMHCMFCIVFNTSYSMQCFLCIVFYA